MKRFRARAEAAPPRRSLPLLATLAALAAWLTACGGGAPEPAPTFPPPPPSVVGGGGEDPPPDSALRDTAPTDAAPEAAEPELPWAERTLASLTLREKAGQLIMPWVLGDFAPEGSDSHERILSYIEELGVGGVIMSVGSPTEVAAKLNDLQRHSKLPLLVAADLEQGAGFRMRGAVQMPGTIELGGATDFPSLMALGAAGDPRLAYEMGHITALEARAVGIHVPFAPVLDVNNNPDNPIINVRSFGADPARVAELGAAFVRGLQDHGAIATGKHFPGHGDTDTDSHLALPVITHDRPRLDSVELVPFRAAIEAGMGAVMTAHIAVPALDGGEREAATLSPGVLTRMLRREMGFDGLLFTDAMDMYAISRRYTPEEAAVRALEAGADVLLMPPDPARAVEGIVAAVQEGRIPESRIDASVLRILRVKAALGLDRERTVPLEEVGRKVGLPEYEEVANEIARRSITVLRNGRNLLPLRGTRTARVMSVTYRRASDVLAGRYFNRRLRATYPRLTTVDLDADTPESVYDALRRQARRLALVIVSTYVTAVSYEGSVALPEETVDFIRDLKRIGVPHIVVSFGNPYLIREFPDVQAYMLAWSGAEVSQRAAADALFGAFEIRGRTPTPIPPLFQAGDGLTIPAKGAARGGR